MGHYKKLYDDRCEEPDYLNAPEQGDEDFITGVAPTYIALLAEAAAVALFVGMVAVWAAIGAGA